MFVNELVGVPDPNDIQPSGDIEYWVKLVPSKLNAKPPGNVKGPTGVSSVFNPVTVLEPVIGSRAPVVATKEYEFAVEGDETAANSVLEAPLQTVAGVAVTEVTFAPVALVITDVVDEVQPNELVDVTVYVVVALGLATTVAPVATSKPAAGNQA